MNDRDVLLEALRFHGHKCWASAAGVRAGLAALEALGVQRSGAKSLHAILEHGDYHGARCFGDGVQYSTGCTLGKGNVERRARGKLAVTLIDKAGGKAVRVAYRPTLQKQIRESSFMRKRSSGVPPTEIPESEAWELVDLIWDAPREQVLAVGPLDSVAWSEPEEIVRFAICEGCEELVAEPYMRLVEGQPRCLDCAGYAA